MAQKRAVVILAAGHGTRMKSKTPKVLHQVGGLSMLGHVIRSVEKLNPEKIICVIGPDMESVSLEAAPHTCVIQEERLGTGHAVQQALPELKGFEGNVLVTYADVPLVSAETYENLIARQENNDAPACTVLAMRASDPSGYGRIVTEGETLIEIVEDADCTPEQKEITLCNSGIIAIEGKSIENWLSQMKNDNAQGEYYLVDVPKIASNSGRVSTYIETFEEECQGVNTRTQLAIAETYFQEQKCFEVMENGATLIDPSSVIFAYDTQIGQDVTIEPNVVFGPEVVIEDGVTIHAFSHLEGAIVKSGAVIGPFARLRPGAEIGENAKVGNFVELKKAKLGKGSKVNHLSYVGDSVVGENSNIGAGTITCNYDGFEKHLTQVGDNVFVGSSSTLIAPLTLENDAYVAAGSVISEDVGENTLAIARSRAILRPGWPETFREKRGKPK